MSTPTPLQIGAVPSPASKKSVHNNVSTPNPYNLSSPAPRSVPSPATTRKEQSGKTPINHATTGSSQGSKTVGGSTPMVPNLSQQGTVSPMPGSSLTGMTPMGLGVDLGTPGHVSMTTPALGASMIPTMSELGLTASGGIKRNEDEERRTKIRKILKTIGKPKGRVSEEGIARISRRVGFANDIDAEKLSAEERERRVGNRTISIAGNTIVIDIDLKEHVPKNLQIVFSNDLASAGDQADRAGRILLDDLTPSKATGVNKMLDKFALNLERLAKLDRLSSVKVNCFDALSGIYTSLRRLYDQEMQLASEVYKNDTDATETDVVNKRSGKPAIHERGKLGLSIAYWRDGAATKTNNTNAMDIDSECKGEVEHETTSDHLIWLETERCQSAMYPSIRTTDSWLPDPLQLKPADGLPQPIPWHNPELPFPGSDGDTANTLADESTHILPDVRFVAKLDPPIVMPWQIAANIFTAVGSTIPPGFQLPSYLTLLLGVALPTAQNSVLQCKSSVLRPSKSEFVTAEHIYNISMGKNGAGYQVEELPFSHPRQIVELLPLFRQWLCFNDLLLQQLNGAAGAALVSDTVVDDKSAASAITPEALGSDRDFAGSPLRLCVEGALLTMPTPALILDFPLDNGELCIVELHVLQDGELRLSDCNIKIDNAAKALNLAGNLGVWIEWMRAQKSAVS